MPTLPTLKINKQTARKLRDICTLIASVILLAVILLALFTTILIAFKNNTVTVMKPTKQPVLALVSSLQGIAGASILHCFESAIEVANKLNIIVEFNHNFHCMVFPDDSAEQGVKNYEQALKEGKCNEDIIINCEPPRKFV